MCYSPRQILVKCTTLHQPRSVYVPCGKCEECRLQYKNDWAFRLSVELEALRSQGWLIGFFTLTYNNKHLPHVPREAFTIGEKYRKIQCFSRAHVRTFIDSLRKELHSHYRFKGLRYLVASEFGEHTKRCHYHGLVCWQPVEAVSSSAISPVLDAQTMHRYICRLWRHGFIFPWSYLGGEDSHGYVHKPFEVSASAFDASHYASKYVTKDLAFQGTLKGVCLKSDAFKDCKCFHIQSKSLGSALVNNASEETAISLLTIGHEFVGKSIRHSLPRYLRNKLIFKSKYVFCDSDGHLVIRQKIGPRRYEYIQVATGEVFGKLPATFKRYVRRELTTFAENNKKFIFTQKLNHSDLVGKLYNDELLESLDIKYDGWKNDVKKLREDVRNYEKRFIRSRFGTFDLHCSIYIGVPRVYCFATRKPELVYFNRFYEYPKTISNNVISEVQYNELHQIYNRLHKLFASRTDYYLVREHNRFINKVNNIIRG